MSKLGVLVRVLNYCFVVINFIPALSLPNISNPVVKNVLSNVVNGGPSQPRLFFVHIEVIFSGPTGQPRYLYCGGTIISPFWVATAGQCVPPGEPTKILVKIGDYSQPRQLTTVVRVTKAVRHAQFTPGSNSRRPSYDLGLVKMETEVTQYRILPPCSNANNPCSLLAACGFGLRRPRISNEQYVLTEALFVQYQGFMHIRCPEDMICTRGARGLDTKISPGDIGSPLYRLSDFGITADCLYGVASFHQLFTVYYRDWNAELDDNTSYFTSMPFFFDWISEQINDDE